MRCVLGDFVFSLKCTHKQCIVELTPVSLSFSHLNMDFKLSETNPGNKCIILMTTNFVYEKPLKSGIFNWKCAAKSGKEPLKTDSECIEINEVNASKAMNLTKERLNASKNRDNLKN